jgi:trans-aconitate methyltransferase
VTTARWNSNIHAFDVVLPLVPPGARRGLDVGCGEGETARMLRRRVAEVHAIDPHEPSIAEARSYGDDIRYDTADLLTASLEPASYDVVSAVAMLHHVDQREGLRRLADLVAPGGVLLVVSHARSRSPREYGRDAWDAVAVRRYTFTRKLWETPAPKVWPPPLTYSETRRASLDVLPDASFRRVPYFRYALTWRKP